MENLAKRKKDIYRKQKIMEIMAAHPNYCLHDIQRALNININHVERYYMMIKRSFSRNKKVKGG